MYSPVDEQHDGTRLWLQPRKLTAYLGHWQLSTHLKTNHLVHLRTVNHFMRWHHLDYNQGRYRRRPPLLKSLLERPHPYIQLWGLFFFPARKWTLLAHTLYSSKRCLLGLIAVRIPRPNWLLCFFHKNDIDWKKDSSSTSFSRPNRLMFMRWWLESLSCATATPNKTSWTSTTFWIASVSLMDSCALQCSAAALLSCFALSMELIQLSKMIHGRSDPVSFISQHDIVSIATTLPGYPGKTCLDDCFSTHSFIPV